MGREGGGILARTSEVKNNNYCNDNRNNNKSGSRESEYAHGCTSSRVS